MSIVLPFVLFKLRDGREKNIWLGGRIRKALRWMQEPRGMGGGHSRCKSTEAEMTMQEWRKARDFLSLECPGRRHEPKNEMPDPKLCFRKFKTGSISKMNGCGWQQVGEGAWI